MNVFISYSAKDASFVRKIADGIRPEVTSVCWWDDSKKLGEESWKQIFGWIDDADLVLAIITGNVLQRSLAVGNEIGYAKAKGKPIIPLITDEKDRFDLGCLTGLVDQYIDEADPQSGIDAIKRHIQNEHLPTVAGQQSEVDWGGALTIIGIIGMIWVGTRK